MSSSKRKQDFPKLAPGLGFGLLLGLLLGPCVRASAAPALPTKAIEVQLEGDVKVA